MENEKRAKLTQHKSEILADALLKLAKTDSNADRLVERLCSDPDEIL